MEHAEVMDDPVAIVAAIGTFLYWLNYVNGWLTADMFDFYN